MAALLLALALGQGAVVWSTSAKVGIGETAHFVAKGLTPGAHYLLVTRGKCETRESGRRRRWREKVNPGGHVPFGVELRVKFEGQDVPVGVDETRTPFKARAETLALTVENRSSPAAGVSCALTSLQVTSP